MCRDCKRVLCFDVNHTEVFRDKLRSDEGDNLCSMVPAFASLSRSNAPAYYREIGELKGRMAYTTMSCFHYCHPEYFNGNDKKGIGESGDEDTRDDPLSALGLSNASTSSSPLADEPHPSSALW
jgi:hypothetical protein